MKNLLLTVVKHLNAGKTRQALIVVRKVNSKVETRTYQSLEVEALCYARLGLFVKSIEQYLMTMQQANTSELKANCKYNIATCQFKIGELEAAIIHLNEAIVLLPKYQTVSWRLLLAQLHFDVRSFSDATVILKSLIVYSEVTVKCIKLLLKIAIQRGDFDKTIYYLKQLEGRISELKYGDFVELLFTVMRHRDIDITNLLNKAQDAEFDKNTLNLIKAQKYTNDGEIESALKSIKLVNVDDIPIKNTQILYYELIARLYIETENYGEAWKNYVLMNQLSESMFPSSWKVHDDIPLHKKFVSLKTRKSRFELPCKIAFVIGFPRSGTTLIENILATQPGTLALDEKHTVDGVLQKMKRDGYRYPQDLNLLSEEYVDELRAYYFERIKDYVLEEDLSKYHLVVDKNPLLLIKLPLLLTLFPDAKIITTLRNPLDCVLSCYMQSFSFSYQLGYFANLKDCFLRYKDVFDLYDHYKTVMCWDEHQVNYEALVSDFNKQVEDLLDFLGINADKNAYLKFNKLAKTRIINTPSNSQVKSGLYKKNVRLSNIYSEHICPYTYLVESKIEKFGYEPWDTH
jgi:tetratricopeptide (TPR) repeat protein